MQTELVWAAGFFDGEGCTSVGRTKGRLYPTITIRQTDREPLDRFVRATGEGHVNGPYVRKLDSGVQGRKPNWVFQSRGSGARRIMELLYPHLCSPKQRQYETVVLVIGG